VIEFTLIILDGTWAIFGTPRDYEHPHDELRFSMRHERWSRMGRPSKLLISVEDVPNVQASNIRN
jgi:hypothetical protein